MDGDSTYRLQFPSRFVQCGNSHNQDTGDIESRTDSHTAGTHTWSRDFRIVRGLKRTRQPLPYAMELGTST
jgi:hypothetical protein